MFCSYSLDYSSKTESDFNLTIIFWISDKNYIRKFYFILKKIYFFFLQIFSWGPRGQKCKNRECLWICPISICYSMIYLSSFFLLVYSIHHSHEIHISINFLFHYLHLRIFFSKCSLHLIFFRYFSLVVHFFTTNFGFFLAHKCSYLLIIHSSCSYMSSVHLRNFLFLLEDFLRMKKKP